MPILEIHEDETNAVIAALHHERVRLAGEWSKAFDNDKKSDWYRDSELERLAAAIDLTTDLRRKIEAGSDEPADIPVEDADAHIFKGAVWHHEHGWLCTANQLQAAVEAAVAAGVSEAELDRMLKIDRESDQEKPSKGLKKIVEDNLENHLLSFYSTDDSSGSGFVAAWGVIRKMSFGHRDTLAFTLENIAKQVLSDVKEDRKHSRSATRSSVSAS